MRLVLLMCTFRNVVKTRGRRKKLNTKVENIIKINGLTDEQVEKRKQAGLINIEVKARSKSVLKIITSNVFTYFNLVFAIIAIILICVESYRDLTFLPIIIANTVIGIVQELRSKRAIDKLKMLNAPNTTVIRNGKEINIKTTELVQDDVVIFKAGDQICADAEVIKGEVAVNEALLTGESKEIHKTQGSKLLSGSFIVSGTCYAKLTKVGAKSYISQLTLEAKKLKQGEQSEMIRSLNSIVKIAGIIIIPIGLALFSQQYFLNNIPLKESVQSMVAAIIGMIPEGLFLLASVTLAISAMKLATNKVLIHDMKSIETLARVNVLCVDKTGTITESKMSVSNVVKLDKFIGSNEELEGLISDFVKAQKRDNITMETLKGYFTHPTKRKRISTSGFSSEFKYSGVEFEGEAYVLGAPEFVLKDMYAEYKEQIEYYNNKGERVLVLCKYQGVPDGKELNQGVIPFALITITNKIRKNAVETFEYFEKQGVEIKVISGDNPITVAQIATQAHIKDADKYIDCSNLKTDEDISKAVSEYTVFGRVTPKQKRKFVKALKELGNTVAMTGDGVNDVLALKDADCSVAMASGSQAAVQASQLVLIESDFAKMPGVVKEGRRVVNNLERSGSLFLVKNIFSLIISILAILFGFKYPLIPAQISLISAFTIGVPAFLLSQAPNTDLIRGKFIDNIIKKALPAGLLDTFVIITMVIVGKIFRLPGELVAALSTIGLAVVGMFIVYRVSKPLNLYKVVVIIICASGLVIGFTFLREFFGINYVTSLL